MRIARELLLVTGLTLLGYATLRALADAVLGLVL